MLYQMAVTSTTEENVLTQWYKGEKETRKLLSIRELSQTIYRVHQNKSVVMLSALFAVSLYKYINPISIQNTQKHTNEKEVCKLVLKNNSYLIQWKRVKKKKTPKKHEHVHKKCTGASVNYEYHVNFHWLLIFKLPVKLNHLRLRLAGIGTKLALPLVHN